jgi:hypothetical protein
MSLDNSSTANPLEDSAKGMASFMVETANAFKWEERLQRLELSYKLTKREQFAAMAMQGLLAQETEDFTLGSSTALVKSAVKYADALIEALDVAKTP